jgi:ornithine decarboxylase
MTPKIASYLADHAPATPCLVVDVDQVELRFCELEAALPLARIYYAVKANPATPILQRLVSLGSCFDAASWEEIRLCLDAGADASAISFGNTIKKASSIASAHAAGISMFAFDSDEELDKLALHAPGARV